MAQQDPWAWANQAPTAPLAATIQSSQEQAPAPTRAPQDPMLSMAQSAAINRSPEMWAAGKTAYQASQAVPLAAEAIPSIGATTTMGALPVAAPLAAEAGTAAALGGAGVCFRNNSC